MPGIAIDSVAVPELTAPDGGGSDGVSSGSGTSPARRPGSGTVEPGFPTDPPADEPLPAPRPDLFPSSRPAFQAGTVIQLIDVSDRAAPRTIQTTELEGQHVSTRVVDGVARVVITTYPQPGPLMDSPALVDPGRLDAGQIEDAIADQRRRHHHRGLAAVVPHLRPDLTVRPRSRARSSPCEDVLVPEVNAGLTETSILRVDFTDGFDPADTTTIVADAGTVYASASTLYVAATRYVHPRRPGQRRRRGLVDRRSTPSTSGATAPRRHVGAGEVPGSTLNQYSLSEYDGYLRIATTEGTPWGGGRARASRPCGSCASRATSWSRSAWSAGSGKTETIQSVRFMGPVGYVVTFRQTDPLYVIDLSDPAAPAAVGELKIPGFSSYLHPAGEGRLIGIGRDADLDGRDQGLLVSLFDVSDPTASPAAPDVHRARRLLGGGRRSQGVPVVGARVGRGHARSSVRPAAQRRTRPTDTASA